MYVDVDGETSLYGIEFLLGGDYGRVISETIGYFIALPNDEVKYHEKLYERDLTIQGRVFTVQTRVTEYIVPRLFRKPLRWSKVEQVGICELVSSPHIVTPNR